MRHMALYIVHRMLVRRTGGGFSMHIAMFGAGMYWKGKGAKSRVTGAARKAVGAGFKMPVQRH